MRNEILLMLHPGVGMPGVLAAVWVFAETLNAGAGNAARIRAASLAVAGLIWLAGLLGGYWYVNFYPVDKALIKAGPWPFAHSFVIESKEHVFFTLLLLATYLPIAAANDLAASAAARRLVLTLAALIVLLGLAMEGGGALAAMAVKLGLLAR